MGQQKSYPKIFYSFFNNITPDKEKKMNKNAKSISLVSTSKTNDVSCVIAKNKRTRL